MQLTIDTDAVVTSNDSRQLDALGELLRGKFFKQTTGFGCYSSFDLNDDVTAMPSEQDDAVTTPTNKFVGF
jgi:hypothetical protein